MSPLPYCIVLVAGAVAGALIGGWLADPPGQAEETARQLIRLTDEKAAREAHVRARLRHMDSPRS